MTDGRIWKEDSIPMNVIGLQLLKERHCGNNNKCVYKNVSIFELKPNESQCTALIMHHGFSDYTIVPLSCNTFPGIRLTKYSIFVNIQIVHQIGSQNMMIDFPI